MLRTKPERYYDSNNARLIYCEKQADNSFWDKHWDKANFKEYVERGKNNRFCINTIKKYLKDNVGLILEGGCGSGQLVYCMKYHGYEPIGVDFSEKTIRHIQETLPNLDVRVADVRNLPFPDNHFTAYWSLGVIEHFWEGYQDILLEMHRVLKHHGYLFVTFPYMSPLRRLKVKYNLYNQADKIGDNKENFYQFALNSKRVLSDFSGNGFELIRAQPMDGIKGFQR
jgi:SAM-dependent methyltransferase